MIHKSGETKIAFKKDFVYEKTPWKGREFKEIYLAEDIFTPGSSGGRGRKTSRDLCKERIPPGKTYLIENGKLLSKDLPLGKYHCERNKSTGRICLKSRQSGSINFIYKDQNTPEIEEKLELQ